MPLSPKPVLPAPGLRRMQRSPSPSPDLPPPRRIDPPEDAPTPPRRRAAGDDDTVDSSNILGVGRAGATKILNSMPSDFSKPFRVPDDYPSIIKFIAEKNVPFVAYRQHWCDWITQGKRSFVCLGEDCPLCDIGDKPRYREVYNVIDLSVPMTPKVCVLEAGITLAKLLKSLDVSPRTKEMGELIRDDLYYAIHRTGNAPGEKGRADTHVNIVKARDLEEDYGFAPLSDEDLSRYEGKVFDKSSVVISSFKDLKEAADRAPD